MTETFDILHVRLITVVVKNNDPRPVLANLIKLLKPGGYIQWDEVDSMNCYVQLTDPRNSVNTVDRLLRQLGGSDE